MSTTEAEVSVIVPVYNESAVIRDCIEALQNQTYASEKYEVLVVDNGSSDETPTIVEESDATLLKETDVQGSYAARNTGLGHTSRDVIAFTDADCTPRPEWIECGVDALIEQDADLAAGKIEFESSPSPCASEQFDMAFNLKSDEAVTSGKAPTANLFVKREVVDDIGQFPTDFRSGGDSYWTSRSTDVGYSIAYAPDAVVSHPTREMRELVTKHHRVGWGQAQMLKAHLSDGNYQYLKRWVKNFVPCPPFLLRNRLSKKEITASKWRFIHILTIVWACQLSQNIGRLNYFLTATALRLMRRT